MRIYTTHTRDAALRELGRLNRWLVAGSVVLTGAFAEAAANAFPGKASKPASVTRGKASGARTTAHAKTSTHPLQPPAQAPRATAEAQSHSSTQSAPAQETTPAQESTPAPESHESAPAQESTPAPESHQTAPAQESTPPQESTPAQEPAPAPEASAPVVSGGS
jgi:hypothetical protein